MSIIRALLDYFSAVFTGLEAKKMAKSQEKMIKRDLNNNMIRDDQKGRWNNRLPLE